MTNMSTSDKVWIFNVRPVPLSVDREGSMLGGYCGMWGDPKDSTTASALEAGDVIVDSENAPKTSESPVATSAKIEAKAPVEVAEATTAEEG